MKVLLLFRGAPGSGKSMFIKRNKLKEYTINPDDIRYLINVKDQPFKSRADYFNKYTEKTVWAIFREELYKRAENGEFIVVNTTNSQTWEMESYLHMIKDYGYQIYIVDMTKVSVKQCLYQNSHYRWLPVPPEIIFKMYGHFKENKVPEKITVLTTKQAKAKLEEFKS